MPSARPEYAPAVADEAHEVRTGEGYAVANVAGLGEGFGFRKVRRELGVTAFGVNALVLPPGYETGRHYHEEQQERTRAHGRHVLPSAPCPDSG